MFEDRKVSNEERLFKFYINELLETGWLDDAIEQPKTFPVFDGAYGFIWHRDKRELLNLNVKLLKPQSYTPDFKLLWNKKAEGVFYWDNGIVCDKNSTTYRKVNKDVYIPFYRKESWIDTKGTFVGLNNNSGITFPKNQALMWIAHEIYVQKIVVSYDTKSIFYRTFTPKNLIINEVYKKDTKDHKVGDSKLRYEPVLLEQWVKRRLHGGT